MKPHGAAGRPRCQAAAGANGNGASSDRPDATRAGDGDAGAPPAPARSGAHDADSPRAARSVRSFVRREGRLTHGQQRALDELWPRFGVAWRAQPLDLDAVFGRHAPRVLEIGFGNGDALASMAAARPELDFLGVEVHRPGVGHLLLQIERLGLTNVRIVSHDAIEVLKTQISRDALQRVHLFFPDPWPKKRHHKRRIVQPAFLDLLASRVVHGGTLHMATDWHDYAQQMFDVLHASAHFDLVNGGDTLEQARVPRPDARPETKFERRGRRRGHDVWDLLATRIATPASERNSD